MGNLFSSSTKRRPGGFDHDNGLPNKKPRNGDVDTKLDIELYTALTGRSNLEHVRTIVEMCPAALARPCPDATEGWPVHIAAAQNNYEEVTCYLAEEYPAALAKKNSNEKLPIDIFMGETFGCMKPKPPTVQSSFKAVEILADCDKRCIKKVRMEEAHVLDILFHWPTSEEQDRRLCSSVHLENDTLHCEFIYSRRSATSHQTNCLLELTRRVKRVQIDFQSWENTSNSFYSMFLHGLINMSESSTMDNLEMRLPISEDPNQCIFPNINSLLMCRQSRLEHLTLQEAFENQQESDYEYLDTLHACLHSRAGNVLKSLSLWDFSVNDITKLFNLLSSDCCPCKVSLFDLNIAHKHYVGSEHENLWPDVSSYQKSDRWTLKELRVVGDDAYSYHWRAFIPVAASKTLRKLYVTQTTTRWSGLGGYRFEKLIISKLIPDVLAKGKLHTLQVRVDRPRHSPPNDAFRSCNTTAYDPVICSSLLPEQWESISIRSICEALKKNQSLCKLDVGQFLQDEANQILLADVLKDKKRTVAEGEEAGCHSDNNTLQSVVLRCSFMTLSEVFSGRHEVSVRMTNTEKQIIVYLYRNMVQFSMASGDVCSPGLASAMVGRILGPSSVLPLQAWPSCDRFRGEILYLLLRIAIVPVHFVHTIG